MRFEKKQNRFLGKWRFEIRLIHQNQIPKVIEWLDAFSIGEWDIVNNILYIDDLQDAFKLRIQFDQLIKLLRQAP